MLLRQALTGQIFAALLLCSFQTYSSSNVGQLTSNQSLYRYEVFTHSDTLVTIFISPECPICQKYTRRINELYKHFNSDSFRVIGVVSGKYYSQKDVERFKLRYGADYEVLLDLNYEQQKKWNASTTPEVILSIGETVYYRGMIDNWFYAIGKSSNKTTNYHLLNAIQSLKADMPIEIEETKPIGCFIE